MTPTCQGATFAAAPEVAASAPKANTLIDALTAEGHCTRFLAAVEKVGLTGTLKSGGPWTVFAPTNKAIASYPGGFDTLMDKPDRLKRFVRAHLVDGRRASTDIKPKETKRWPTADGRNLVVEKKGESVIVDSKVKVIRADIAADNGLIYTIDGVLTP